ncbi:response regulator [Nitrosopumilus sp.]|uniref:TackOD1 domain-containing metal-binding protein n=1 Tax=Nitrosopumilus sp. TaxID=2024843 RepID=UPI0034A09860
MGSKESVLIIEDSPAVGMLLAEFMRKLGYTDIKTAETGRAGISLFKQFVEKSITPLIFLDYNLPDSTANSIMSQILSIKPFTKIIIETANGKEEESIKEVIGLGAYHYLQKPIHFNDVEKIITILEEEESYLAKKSRQSDAMEEDIDETKIAERINFIFQTNNQVSLNKIIEILGFSNNFIESYLKKLEKEGKIISLDTKKEVACNQCDSIRTSQVFFCPNCKSSDFKLGKLIEHYDCGNITEENTYQNDICPNCKKEIKALGVDYRVMKNHYMCNNCKDFFPEISTNYICLKCENKFRLEEARWKSSVNYKVVNRQ